MNRQPPPHGDRRRHAYWQCRCAPCREAERIYRKRHRFNRAESAFVDPTGTRRRIRGMVAMGYTMASIAAEMDCTTNWVRQIATRDIPRGVLRRTRDEVKEACRRMLATPPPGGHGATYARTVANRTGWYPLAVWDDIDDPDAHPVLNVAPDPGYVDEEKVRRALHGFHTDLSDAELVAVVRAGVARGTSFTRMCDRLSVNRERVRRLMDRFEQEDRSDQTVAA